MGLIKKLVSALISLFVFIWDFQLFLLNFILPESKPGEVVPPGVPGYHGAWPRYIAPMEGDSRSACPMINAMANHGILPRDGKNISFRELNARIRETFNFAPTFCFFVPNFAANFLNRSYWNDTFDLEELSKHNEIEHDASLTRKDFAHEPKQGKPDLELVEELLDGATGEAPDGSPKLTKKDLSLALAKRRISSKRDNREYTQKFPHKMFGAANSSAMLKIFDGLVDDLRPMLTEERFSKDWQPRVRSRFGLTITAFNATVIPVLLGASLSKVKLNGRSRVKKFKKVS